jgi:site-specific recombinase XerD
MSASAAGQQLQRGRPRGTRSRVLADGRQLGHHHFAFLRAWFQGVDLRRAWDRYMAFAADSSDARVIERTRIAVLGAVLSAGHQADRSRPELGLKRWLDLIARPPFSAAIVPIPSLDDWVVSEGLDRDFHTEAELLALYKEHYGLDTPPESGAAEAPVNEQIKALNLVASVLARAPSADDRVALWVSPRLAAAIQAAGAATLGRLVDLVNVHGYRWYTRVAGLGERRARTLLLWLSGIADELGRPVREASLQPPQRQAALRSALARDVVAPPRFALVPIERLSVPPPLLGRDGLFRSPAPNTLGASNDLEALTDWLSRYGERAHTQRAYRKEVERFYLWCLMVAKKPLSSVTSPDCQSYRRFLQAIPIDWLQERTVAKTDPAWRPFRGALSPSSQRQALVVVQAMFEGLQQSGYLVANPMAMVMKTFSLPVARIQVERSLTAREWAFVLDRARAEPPCPEQRRTLLVLELLGRTGLRLDELAGALLSALDRVAVDGEHSGAWVLNVVGKRRKPRQVPVPDAVVDLVERHHKDLAASGWASSASAPLIGALADPPKRWAAGQGKAELIVPPHGAGLSASGIYRALKRFFARCAHRAVAAGVDPERLQAASTHWLRHTFARHAVAAGAPTDVVQQALGHESLATTGIYVTTERSRMIRELRKVWAPE